MKNAINIYQPIALNIFDEKATVLELATGFKFAEGPLWHPDNYLLFSDIPQNRIFQVYLNGITYVPLHHSGGLCFTQENLSDMIGSNGLALDKEGNIIICQHGNHAISKLNSQKQLTILCSSYNGKPFNSPNDLVIKNNGAIYFTDPPYGLKNQVLNPIYYQPHGGVYMYYNNQVKLLHTDLLYPNGICFSTNEKYMFVGSNHPNEKYIYKYELNCGGEIVGRTTFANINADGLKIDRYNNLFAATNEGVVVFSKYGEKIALIAMKDMVTNIAFGGAAKNILFITTPSTVYYVHLNYDQKSILVAPEQKSDSILNYVYSK